MIKLFLQACTKSSRGNISQFLETVARPHVLKEDSLDAGYETMAADQQRETEADEWCEALMADGIDDSR